nr:uncharacterized protein LOC114826818 [Malus domestica]
MDDAKPCVTPLSTSKLDHSSPLLDDPTEYRSLVGALQHLTWTRPDLSFAVNLVCQFMYCPRLSHLQAVKRILRYLKGSIQCGLWFSKSSSSPCITAYFDADWASCSMDRRSTGGFDQVADICTKALSKSRFLFLRCKLALRQPQISLKGNIEGINVNADIKDPI